MVRLNQRATLLASFHDTVNTIHNSSCVIMHGRETPCGVSHSDILISVYEHVLQILLYFLHCHSNALAAAKREAGCWPPALDAQVDVPYRHIRRAQCYRMTGMGHPGRHDIKFLITDSMKQRQTSAFDQDDRAWFVASERPLRSIDDSTD